MAHHIDVRKITRGAYNMFIAQVTSAVGLRFDFVYKKDTKCKMLSIC